MADITDEEIRKRFLDKMKKDASILVGNTSKKPSKTILVSEAPDGKIFEFNSPKLKTMGTKRYFALPVNIKTKIALAAALGGTVGLAGASLYKALKDD